MPASGTNTNIGDTAGLLNRQPNVLGWILALPGPTKLVFTSFPPSTEPDSIRTAAASATSNRILPVCVDPPSCFCSLPVNSPCGANKRKLPLPCGYSTLLAARCSGWHSTWDAADRLHVRAAFPMSCRYLPPAKRDFAGFRRWNQAYFLQFKR